MPRRTARRRTKFVSNTPDFIDNNPQQGAQLPPRKPTKGLGAEAARQIRENTSTNTRYVDKPSPTSSKELLRQIRENQQRLIQEAQEQVSRQRTGTPKPSAKPSPQPSAQELLNQIKQQRISVSTPTPTTTPTPSRMPVQVDAPTVTPSAAPSVASSGATSGAATPTAKPLPNKPFMSGIGGTLRLGFNAVASNPIVRGVAGTVMTGMEAQEFVDASIATADWMRPLAGINPDGTPMTDADRRRANQPEQFSIENQVKGQDAYNAYREQYEREQLNKPIQPGEAPPAPVLPPPTPEARSGAPEVEPQPQRRVVTQQRQPEPLTRSNGSIRFSRPAAPSPEQLINAEYDRLRSTNPQAAKEYGLAKHRELFPALY
jgi:hypothetical protein